jgi:hypothetical protein
MIDVEIEQVKTPYLFSNATGIKFNNVTINGKKAEVSGAVGKGQ